MEQTKEIDIKSKAIRNLFENKILGLMSKEYFAKNYLGYKTRSTLDRILEGRASKRAVDGCWERLKRKESINDTHLLYLSNLEENYQSVLKAVGNDAAKVYDCIYDIWFTGKVPSEAEEHISLLTNEPFFTGMLLAYSFYKQAPQDYNSQTLHNVITLFYGKFEERYRSFDLYVSKKIEVVNLAQEFTIGGFCCSIGPALDGLKTKNFHKYRIEPWKEDTCWINLLEYPEGTTPETFSFLKYLEDGVYCICKSTIDPVNPTVGPCAQFFFLEYERKYVIINDAKKAGVLFLDLSDTELVIYDTEKTLYKYRKVDISTHEDKVYNHVLENRINKTIKSNEFEEQFVNSMVEWIKKTGLDFPDSYTIVDCIKTKSHLLYKIKHQSNSYWVSIDLLLYPELNDIPLREEPDFIDKDGQRHLAWLEYGNSLAIDGLEHLSNEDVIKFLHLNN